jgi:hypothetical protein
MIPGELTAIDEPLLASACAQRWPESQTLDFKRLIPGTDERSSREFLKDVCAMANSDGGDLVYGIDDAQGHANVLSPISATAEPSDAAKRRLSQLLQSAIEPRIEGVSVHAVVLVTGDYVLVVRIPSSFQRPHRFRSGGHTRWVVRVGTHTVDLTYEQIRDAFARTATLTEGARRFRDERISRVLSNTTGRPMQSGPRCVVHLIPIASIAGKASADIRHLYNAYQAFMYHDWSGATRTLNLDGLVVHPGGQADSFAYTQIFRTGVLEASRFMGATRTDLKIIPSGVISGFIRDSIQKFITAAVQWNISGPAIIAASLLNVGEYSFAFQGRYQVTQQNAADRMNMILPEIWIEQLGNVQDIDSIARPLLDTLWQAFDLEACGFYNASGTWGLF